MKFSGSGVRAASGCIVASLFLSLALAACGGGSSGRVSTLASASVLDTASGISGTVDTSTTPIASDTTVTVCLDQNGDYKCESGEPQAVADSSGGFSIAAVGDVSLSGLNLVAEITPASATTASYVLAAPAASSTVIDALTTLAATRPPLWLSLTTTTDPIALLWQAWTASTTLNPVVAGDAEATRINNAIQPAFVAAVPVLLASEGSVGSMAAATKNAASTVGTVLAKYVDTSTKLLLRTVTERTFDVEVGYAASPTVEPTACTVQPVVPMSIATTDGANIVSKDDYLTATVQLTGYDGTVQSLSTSIKGHGNTTWEMPKKPYRLKLDKKASLLGMASAKNWILLANYSDKTMMRNAVAMCLGQMLGLPHTPAQKYVELTLNGDYVGVYQLSERVEDGSPRVDIGEVATTDDDTAMGFLLEIDAHQDEDYVFTSSKGVLYGVQSDLEDAGQLPLVTSYINSMETALFADDFEDSTNGYAKYLDTDSLVDFYLVNEFLRNNDAFYSSTYLYRPRDGIAHFGPLWDFDIAAGNINYNGNDATDGWWVRYTSVYVDRLLDDEQFQQHLKARWKYLSARVPQLQKYITDEAASLDDSQARNFVRWPILDSWVWPNSEVSGSYSGEVGFLQEWLTARATWLDSNM